MWEGHRPFSTGDLRGRHHAAPRNAVSGRRTAPARTIDPLYAKGFVLLSERQQPVVLAALDWCEIRNDSYDGWRDELAEAAGTTRERVLLHCVHQHDAPYVDETAQRLLKEAGVEGDLCLPEADAAARAAVAAAVRRALDGAQPVSHIGTGLAKTAELVSNRRYVVMEDGRVSWGRTSATRDPKLRALPPGLVDPYACGRSASGTTSSRSRPCTASRSTP